MSDASRKVGNALSLAEYRKYRAAQREQAKESAVAVGAPTAWADMAEGRVFPKEDEFLSLVQSYTDLRTRAGQDAALKKIFSLRMEAIRSATFMESWRGKYVSARVANAENWTTHRVMEALAHFRPEELDKNPYGLNLEFQYQTQTVTPYDRGLLYMCLGPEENKPWVTELAKRTFQNPLLVNMYARLNASVVDRVPYDTIAKYYEEAVRRNNRFPLVRMTALPDPFAVKLSEDKNPGYPWNIMPRKDDPKRTYTTIEQVFDERDVELQKAILDLMKYFVTGKRGKGKDALDERHLYYCLQAGNVKHILRSEADKKPDRCIFSAPLALRMLSGSISQPFMTNWHHPRSLLKSNFANGDTLDILATCLGVDLAYKYTKLEPDILALETEKVMASVLEKIILETPDKKLGLREGVRIIRLKSGCAWAPDKSSYDLGMRYEFMTKFAQRTEGVLPDIAAIQVLKKYDPEKAKALYAQWAKVNNQCHYVDSDATVVTNHRVVFKLGPNKSGRNPSGSMWVTCRNTEIDINAEMAASLMVWAKKHPNRDLDQADLSAEITSCYGDDSFSYFPGHTVEQATAFVKAKAEMMQKIGWKYKPDTMLVTNNISELEILGRHIYAYVEPSTGKVLGFFGVRPELKIWCSYVYPKHMPGSGVSAEEYALARLYAANDEGGLAYPHLHQELRRISGFYSDVKPKSDDWYDPLWEVPIADHFRNLNELIKLHTGLAGVSPASRVLEESPEGTDSDVDVEEMLPTELKPPPSPNPSPLKTADVQRAERKAAKQKQREEPEVAVSDMLG